MNEIEPVIAFRHITRVFGSKIALDDLTLEIPRGGVYGLVGENGAGKTTLLKHALGLYKPRSLWPGGATPMDELHKPSVRVFGLDPVADPVGVLSRVGYLSEERELPDWMRVDELMNYTKAFFPKWDDAYAEELRARFDLNPRQVIRSLSRGQRAQAGLIAALAHRPDLLLLDEPSSGLDPVVRRDILGAIIRTVADEGRTVVFSSHLLDEIERVCDRVAMIHGGRLVLCGELDQVKEAHRRVALRFASPRTARPELPGALSCEGSGQEWTAICNGRLAELKAAAAQQGAEVVEEGVPSLDEIFIARVKG